MFTRTNNVARLSRLAGLAVTVVSAAPALSQSIAYEGFNYPALSSLMGHSGGAGFSAPWQSAGYGIWYVWSPDSIYVKNGLSLQTSGGRTFATHGGMQRALSLANPIGNSPGTVWISFIAQQEAGVSDQSWLGVTLPTTGSANPSLFLGKPFGQPNWGSDAGLEGSVRQTSRSARTQALIVARIDTTNGADDVYVWVNPSLAAVPSIATADLSLPAYGNFRGITKLLLETGSTGPIQSSGTIDEIRLGHTFADVAPIKPGLVSGGFAHVPLGQAILENTSPDMLSISNIGGTGQDGVEIALNSLAGSALTIRSGSIPPEASIRVDGINWHGNVLHASTIQRTAGGDHQLICDFSGYPNRTVTSVQMTAYDGAGNLIQDATTAGPIAVGDLNPFMMIPPCPDGRSQFWYEAIDTLRDSSGRIIGAKLVWVFGCGERGFYPRPNSNTISFAALFDPCPDCVSDTGGIGGTERVIVTGSGVGSFGIEDIEANYHGALVSGLGDAMISQSCSDGSDCSDPALQQLSIANIGGTGNDGVRIQPPAGGVNGSMEYSLGGLSALTDSPAGQIVSSLDVVTSAGTHQPVNLLMQPAANGGLRMTLDAAALGVTGFSYTVFQDGVVVGTGQTAMISVNYPHYVNEWVKFWCTVGSTWPGLSAQFENYGLAVGGGGGGGETYYPGNQIEIRALNAHQVASINTLSITGQDLTSGLIDITSLAWAGIAASCPADFDQDGALDFFDYDAFVNAFESGASNADFDQDGTIDFFDYDAFVIAFELGC